MEPTTLTAGAYVNHCRFPGVVWQIVEVGPHYVQADLIVGELPPWMGTSRRRTLWRRELTVLPGILDALVTGPP